ncbi:MAG: hypothetical protein KME35_23885 [Aphanocapsa sp. GSE-SYN-MK-11-07L]|jgi:hypothetical protein|nr:hypothetical protein [Aphanocapsa sp. GSE-SYN-MK-11-07L]
MTTKTSSIKLTSIQKQKTNRPDEAAARLLKNLEVKRKKFLGPIKTPSGAWINVYATTRKGHVLVFPLDQDGFEGKFYFLAKVSQLIPIVREQLGY